MIAIDKLVVV